MRKLTHKQFVDEVNKIHKGGIKFLENYVNSRVKIKSRCGICKHIWMANPRWLYRGCGCPECGKKKAAETPKWGKAIIEFPEKLKKIHGSKFKILSGYKSGIEKIRVKCRDCKREFTTLPIRLLNKRYSGCAVCGHIKKGIGSRISPDLFKKSIYKINPNIEILGEYKTGDDRIEVKCKKCGHIWSPESRNLRRRGCPLCPSSKGEDKIKSILRLNKIKFKPQYTFENFKNSRGQKYRFDFGIIKDGELSHLIEFDGEQHFKLVKVWGGSSRLDRQKEIDKLKNEYCEENNIRLIRINYKIRLEKLTIDMLR